MKEANELKWEEFQRVEMYAGTVLAAEPFPEARKPAYKLTIDFGPLGVRKTSAQITRLYAPDDLAGRQVIAVLNFPPKQIGPFMSECLVLGTYGPDGAVTLLRPERAVENGARVG